MEKQLRWLGAFPGGIHVFPNGDILIGTNYQTPGQPTEDYVSRLIKYNPQGGIIFQKDFLPAIDSWLIDLEVLDNGNIIAVGNYRKWGLPYPAKRIYLAQLDSFGELGWWRMHWYYEQTLGAQWAYDLNTTSDGGFLIAGLANADTTTSYPGLDMAWLLKTDSMGCVYPPGCISLGIERVSGKQIIVFPNPFTNELKIEEQVDGMELFDLTGRSVGSSKNNSMTGLEHLPSAIYILKSGRYRTRVMKH